jgi:hypothetical protein
LAAVSVAFQRRFTSEVTHLLAPVVCPPADAGRSCVSLHSNTALEPQLRALPPPILLELAWALGRLRYQPAQPWVAGLLGALGAARAGLSAQQLGLLGWALAQMQVSGLTGDGGR